jgi:hypothetical protein
LHVRPAREQRSKGAFGPHVGRVEHVVDDGVSVEHDVVHPLGDLRALGLDHRGRRLQDVDRLRANVMQL